jgi:penicillin-insensitive murein endopeptidase
MSLSFKLKKPLSLVIQSFIYIGTLRIACPSDSEDCEAQEPVPPGDGCDAGLDWWFQQHPATPTISPPPPKPRLPEECRAVLEAP